MGLITPSSCCQLLIAGLLLGVCSFIRRYSSAVDSGRCGDRRAVSVRSAAAGGRLFQLALRIDSVSDHRPPGPTARSDHAVDLSSSVVQVQQPAVIRPGPGGSSVCGQTWAGWVLRLWSDPGRVGPRLWSIRAGWVPVCGQTWAGSLAVAGGAVEVEVGGRRSAVGGRGRRSAAMNGQSSDGG